MDPMAGFSLSTDTEVDRSLYTMLEPEGQRYASFSATLEQTAPQLVARATALAFYDKSSLGPAEIEALYASVKRVGVVADAAVVNETEFVMAMHLIVCLTKRGLAAVPQPFPTYLFPTLTLPSTASSISSMPSPDKPSGLGLSSSSIGDLPGSAAPLDSAPTATTMATLAGSTSLVELTQKEVQNQQIVTTQLARIDQSSATTLQQLHATLDALAAAVEQMGFPVPPATHASIGAIDDLGNLLRANVQTVRQEIQSLEIGARMRSVADEATSRTNSLSGVNETPTVAPSETSAAIAAVAQLSSQLATLQHEATQLRATKESLVRQLLDKKKKALPSGPPPAPISVKTVSSASPPLPSSASSTSSVGMAASAVWGDFSGTSPAAVAPLAPPQETTRSTEAVPPSSASSASSAEAFGFAAFPATVPTGAASSSKPQDADFGWGAFE